MKWNQSIKWMAFEWSLIVCGLWAGGHLRSWIPFHSFTHSRIPFHHLCFNQLIIKKETSKRLISLLPNHSIIFFINALFLACFLFGFLFGLGPERKAKKAMAWEPSAAFERGGREKKINLFSFWWSYGGGCRQP